MLPRQNVNYSQPKIDLLKVNIVSVIQLIYVSNSNLTEVLNSRRKRII